MDNRMLAIATDEDRLEMARQAVRKGQLAEACGFLNPQQRIALLQAKAPQYAPLPGAYDYARTVTSVVRWFRQVELWNMQLAVIEMRQRDRDTEERRRKNLTPAMRWQEFQTELAICNGRRRARIISTGGIVALLNRGISLPIGEELDHVPKDRIWSSKYRQQNKVGDMTVARVWRVPGGVQIGLGTVPGTSKTVRVQPSNHTTYTFSLQWVRSLVASEHWVRSLVASEH